ncbi:putative S-adenosylmethionine-dependent methyltransferase [compost metagenome]
MEHIERIDPFKHKQELMYPEHIARYMFAKQFTSNCVVLDCSCGNGYGSHYLALHGAAKVVGVDISEEAVNFSRQYFSNNNLNYMIGDASNLKEIQDNSIDVYVCFETIEHLSNADSMLREAKRVLTTDGILLISCPNDNVFKPNNPYHYDIYTKEKFASFVGGFFKYSKLFVQNNMVGTSILSPEHVEKANEHQNSIDSLAYTITAKSVEDADTWLLVCSDKELSNDISPVTTFFTTYSDYVIEIQQTIQSLYDENQELAKSWEEQKKYIIEVERQHRQTWKEQQEYIAKLEKQNKQIWEEQQEYIAKLEKQSKQVWEEHVNYIKRLEEENKKLADAWETHVKYIRSLEQNLKNK